MSGETSSGVGVIAFLVTVVAPLFCSVTRQHRKRQRNKKWTSKFVKFLKEKGIRCVVFDMDHTMSSSHCGEGLLLAELQNYVRSVSTDFISLVSSLALDGAFELAVATGSDPAE